MASALMLLRVSMTDSVNWRVCIVLLLLLLFLAHQHKACRQLKIKQEMTAVGD